MSDSSCPISVPAGIDQILSLIPEIEESIDSILVINFAELVKLAMFKIYK
jgi:hypothetical protein